MKNSGEGFPTTSASTPQAYWGREKDTAWVGDQGTQRGEPWPGEILPPGNQKETPQCVPRGLQGAGHAGPEAHLVGEHHNQAAQGAGGTPHQAPATCPRARRPPTSWTSDLLGVRDVSLHSCFPSLPLSPPPALPQVLQWTKGPGPQPLQGGRRQGGSDPGLALVGSPAEPALETGGGDWEGVQVAHRSLRSCRKAG